MGLKWLQRKSKAKKIFEWSFAGHNFIVLDPGAMPVIRRNLLYKTEYAMRWGLEKEDFILFANYLKQHAENPKEVYHVSSLFEALVEEDLQYRPLVKAATTFVLLEGEPVDEVNTEWYEKKLALCSAHEEIESFFLSNILSLGENLLNTSDTFKQQEWLNQERLRNMEKIFYEKIGKTLYEVTVSSKMRT